MITKGYIVGKSTQSSNKYLVRIPIFESAGIGQTNNELNSSVSECTLSHNPGTYEALKPGDCVFVSFEDNRFSQPIILGKLFVNVEEQSSGYQYNTDLKVTHKATLPADTTIGNVPFDNILNYFESINTAIDRLSTQTISSASANITLFSTTTASDVSGYFKLASSVDSPDYNQTAVDVATGVINTDNQLVGQLISEPNLIVGSTGTINISTIGNIKRTSGNNNKYAAFYFKIFKRSSLGVETEIAISNETPDIIISNIYEEFSVSALLNNITFVSTDRIVIKYFAALTGNTGSNYDFQFGGTNPVKTLFPILMNSSLSLSGGNITGTLNVSNKIGVGTNSPASLLHLSSSPSAGSTPVEMIRLENIEPSEPNDLVPGQGPSITFYVPEGNQTTGLGGQIAVVRESFQDNNNASSMTFWTAADDAAATEKVRITSNGRVGIGLTNPSYTLHVNSGGTASDYFYATQTNGNGFIGQWNIVYSALYEEPFSLDFSSITGWASILGSREVRITIDAVNEGFDIRHKSTSGATVQRQRYRTTSAILNWSGSRSVSAGSSLLYSPFGTGDRALIILERMNFPETDGVGWFNGRIYYANAGYSDLLVEGPIFPQYLEVLSTGNQGSTVYTTITIEYLL